MAERPAILTAEQVRDALAGREVVTVKDVKPMRGYEHNSVCRPDLAADPWAVWWHGVSERVGCLQVCPLGVPGDRLWVRETFWAKHDTDADEYRTLDCGPCLDLGPKYHPGIQYVATPENPERPDEPGDWWEAPPDDWDGQSDYKGKGTLTWLPWGEFFSKQPSTRMPRWASRLTLEVVSVDVRRNEAGVWQWVRTARPVGAGK